jgi:glycosyltransferase involved in cell wall biosynthesis
VSSQAPLWLADWSDSEDEDFRWAWRKAGIDPHVLRARPLGPTVGTRWHRLRSWPAYLSLAARGLRAADGALVAWQPLAGAVAAQLRRTRRRPPILILGPLVPAERSGIDRLAIAGWGRADRLLVYTREAIDAAVALGIPREKVGFTPLGVRPRREHPLPPGDYLLAAGRDQRDWDTLAKAADKLEMEVVVAGPRSLPGQASLRLAPQASGDPFFALLEGAAALVLPLHGDRSIGHLSMLAAMSVGRAIVVTQSPGIEDYVTDSIGALVPPRDPEALRQALVEISDPAVAAEKGAAALAAAKSTFSLERFVKEVDAEARAL